MADTTIDICDYRIADNVAASCGSTSILGVKNTGYIFNYDDINWDADKTVVDEDNENIYKSIQLNSGCKAYQIYVPGNTPFTGTNKALATGTYANTFTKQVSIVVLDNGPEVVKKIIDKLANGTFCVILENKHKGKDNHNMFEIYGFETGLKATELSDDKYSEDSNGGWLCTLEESGASKAGIYLFNDSLATTRTQLKSLCTEAS